MTIPANFPERVNQRRKNALAYMEEHPTLGGEFRERDMQALRDKIVQSARDVRTKKNRIGHARIK